MQQKKGKATPAAAAKRAQAQPVGLPSTIAATYKNKVNVQTMTDFKVKYDYMDKGGEPQSMKEWSLQKDLDDAHILIQELQAKRA